MMTAVDWRKTVVHAAPPTIFSGGVEWNSLRIFGKLRRAAE
jgi:hypothetical protein